MLTTSAVAPVGSSPGNKNTVRIVVTECCLLHPINEHAIRHCDIGEELVVSKEDAASVCGARRAGYLDIADDRTKGKLTADKGMLAAIAVRKRQRAEALTQQPAPAAGMSPSIEVIAAAVARAVVSALQSNRDAR